LRGRRRRSGVPRRGRIRATPGNQPHTAFTVDRELPVAFSAGMLLNCAPVAGRRLATVVGRKPSIPSEFGNETGPGADIATRIDIRGHSCCRANHAVPMRQ
jgi:hypothetical protein